MERRVAAMARDGAKPRASAGGSSRRHPGVRTTERSGVDDPRICAHWRRGAERDTPQALSVALRVGARGTSPGGIPSWDRRGRHVGNCSPLAALQGKREGFGDRGHSFDGTEGHEA